MLFRSGAPRGLTVGAMSTKHASPDATATAQPQAGPYDETEVTTYEISPIKVSITKSFKSTHVPPAKTCGCSGAEKDKAFDDMLASLMDIAVRMSASAPPPNRAPSPPPPDDQD